MTNGCDANDFAIYENGSAVLCPGSGQEIVLSTECWSLNGPGQMRSLMLVEYLCRNNEQSQAQSFMKIKGYSGALTFNRKKCDVLWYK